MKTQLFARGQHGLHQVQDSITHFHAPAALAIWLALGACTGVPDASGADLNMQLVGQWPAANTTITPPAWILAGAVGGKTIVFQEAGGAVDFIDVTIPAQPRKIASYVASGATGPAFLSGTLLHVPTGAGLDIVDVADPSQPIRLVRYGDAGFSYVTVADNYAYLSGGLLYVVDIHDPTHPQELSRTAFEFAAIRGAVSLASHYGYVPLGMNGVGVVDLANPAAPVKVSTIVDGQNATKISVIGNTALVLSPPFFATVYDVSNPSEPVRKTNYTSSRGTCYDFASAGQRVFTVGGGNPGPLEILDASNPAHLSLLGTLDRPNASLVEVAGNFAYLVDDEGLSIVDVSNPSSAKYVASRNLPLAPNAYHVVVQNSYAYIASRRAGLQILDVHNPASPQYVGGLSTTGSVRGIAVSGDRAYVAGADGLLVFDVSVPNRPVRLAVWPDAFVGADVAVSGSLAFVADGAGLAVVDVSNPASPYLTGSYNLTGGARAIAVQGHYAFLANNSPGLVAVDISDPTFPESAGTCRTSGEAYGITVSGNFAYVADSLGVTVADISDPTRIIAKGASITLGMCSAVAASGDYAFVVNGGGGLHAVNVNDPTHPTKVADFDTAGSANGLAVVGNFAYVADGAAGLAVIRLRDQLALNPPVLGADKISLSWNGGAGIKLQTATSLGSPQWLDVSGSQDASGIEVPMSGAAAFFRVVKP